MTSTEIINKAKKKKTVYKMKKQTDEKGKPMTCWGGLEEPKQGFPMQNLIDIMEADDELRPKQETIEEIAEKYSKNKLSKLGFINGYKLAQEILYTEEEVEDLVYNVCGTVGRLQGLILDGSIVDEAYKKYKKR